MDTVKISSAENQKIKHIKKLIADKDYRHECREYVIEGVRALQNSKNLKELYVREKANSLNIKVSKTYSLPDKIFCKISSTENSQGVIAVSGFSTYKADSLDKNSTYVLLDALQDPGNMGTIIRSACAFKVKGIIITPGCVDPFSPKVARSATGSLEKIDIIKIKDVSELEDFTIIAADKKGKKLEDFSWPVSFILAIGNEAHGISCKLNSAAKQIVSIPVSDNTESLNAAVAAAILLYDYRNKNQ
ncbi:MAG: RNA methyltransferase [Endomicrobiales bacterium]|nr:RNA methyltransferase [Endomicrobiales bacterium]